MKYSREKAARSSPQQALQLRHKLDEMICTRKSVIKLGTEPYLQN